MARLLCELAHGLGTPVEAEKFWLLRVLYLSLRSILNPRVTADDSSARGGRVFGLVARGYVMAMGLIRVITSQSTSE